MKQWPRAAVELNSSQTIGTALRKHQYENICALSNGAACYLEQRGATAFLLTWGIIFFSRISMCTLAKFYSCILDPSLRRTGETSGHRGADCLRGPGFRDIWSCKMKKIATVSLMSIVAACGVANPFYLTAAQAHSHALASANSAFTDRKAPSTTDESAFLRHAYEHGLTEIAVSKFALRNATDGNVTKFATRTIDDHRKINERIRHLAQQKNIGLPSEPTSEQRTMLQNLASLSGVELDLTYLHHNLMMHEMDVAGYRARAESESDPEMRIFFANTLPILREHRHVAERINEKIESIVVR
jgi:putative membrane protein